MPLSHETAALLDETSAALAEAAQRMLRMLQEDEPSQTAAVIQHLCYAHDLCSRAIAALSRERQEVRA
jgi:hypothetical protein